MDLHHVLGSCLNLKGGGEYYGAQLFQAPFVIGPVYAWSPFVALCMYEKLCVCVYRHTHTHTDGRTHKNAHRRPYRAVNTLNICYTKQSVNLV
jgi:hypothetical protein